MDVKDAVLKGYSDRIAQEGGSMGSEAAQVCRMDAYDPDLLKCVPTEIIERDYGCGNPSKFAKPGETVLDLGSGSGKICYILAQIVGAKGEVIGVDMNTDMLALARSHQEVFAKTVGFSNLRFARGSIDDLKTNLDFVEQTVSGRNLGSLDDYDDLQRILKEQRNALPLIEDNSVDLIVSNCVINLVDTDSKRNVLEEIFRVLKPNGRIALSDNVSNIDVPDELKNDPDLWVGCYSGVYQEQAFYTALEEVGFTGLVVADRADVPEKTIGDVTFQSVTVTAFKPENVNANPGVTTVLYKGPWAQVSTETGLVLHRGDLTDIDMATANQLHQSAFADHLYFLNDPNVGSTSGCCG
ncbi:arsinothricin biosynthesis methyltransferase ArsM [Actibacterium sp. 188UL27-1]|uniref:arsinothricin biosynthesis methyltransferase ArsM n=1 Tax=Actibacterium sp. 188UL27-1 TaxID=2786961 RepID=UPI00195C3FF9|nr:arsinothricin biosynthesis methyltransferase ArsM [Actibacterium sp. 188UL27-1]MBM7068586.1 methyltransferase domain-containing protein [Actibacterium sp. 188UL27-1]